jgi:hypothetical protein
VQHLRKRTTELEGEVSEIETSLKKMNGESTFEQVAVIVPHLAGNEADPSEGGRIGPQTLKIEIDWEANGKKRAKETILQPMAGDSMVMFLSRLVEELGQDAVQKLSRLRVNRGPLISISPKTDYLNHAQGKVYSHKRLRGTEYFVLTHSQTSQKADDLSRICRVLGFVPGSVQIRAVDRAEYYKEKYA